MGPTGKHSESSEEMKTTDSPVDKVIFLQVLTATGNVPSHMQKIQHGQGGGVVLWEDKRPADEGTREDGTLLLFVRRQRPVMLLYQESHPFKNHFALNMVKASIFMSRPQVSGKYSGGWGCLGHRNPAGQTILAL